jgi:hypothetical protein
LQNSFGEVKTLEQFQIVYIGNRENVVGIFEGSNKLESDKRNHHLVNILEQAKPARVSLKGKKRASFDVYI